MFFFFKQKTAYEMRISDWSSDVCSSDLVFGAGPRQLLGQMLRRRDPARGGEIRADQQRCGVAHRQHRLVGIQEGADQPLGVRVLRQRLGAVLAVGRSEEHTSELQSLMRISYAVFCLKKNTINYQHHTAT